MTKRQLIDLSEASVFITNFYEKSGLVTFEDDLQDSLMSYLVEKYGDEHFDGPGNTYSTIAAYQNGNFHHTLRKLKTEDSVAEWWKMRVRQAELVLVHQGFLGLECNWRLELDVSASSTPLYLGLCVTRTPFKTNEKLYCYTLADQNYNCGEWAFFLLKNQ